MIFNYNKLVRDKIVDNIKKKGVNDIKYKILDDDEYLECLNKKLIEEAHEFIENNDVEELGDVMEVICSIMKVKNIAWEDVKNIADKKREKRGGFDKKIYLEYVDEDVER